MEVHQLGEVVVVGAFDQVRELMDNDVLQAAGILLRQLGVEPDGARPGLAGAPFCLHAAHHHLARLNPDNRLPLVQQGRHRLLQLPPVPAVQHRSLLILGVLGRRRQPQRLP